MKRLLLYLVLFSGCLSVHPLFAQSGSGSGSESGDEITLSVAAAGRPVGFAYIILNDGFYAMADSTGMSGISARRLRKGDTLSALFVGMESVPFVYDGNRPENSVIPLELIPNIIEEVVVAAKDPSNRLFRKYVEKVPTHGWYVGFRGSYDMAFRGDGPWVAKGTFVRNHIPGEYANLWETETFVLRPEEGSTGLGWQVQNHILLVKGIAERAVQLNDYYDSNKGMIMKYRGRSGNQNVFLILKPYFDRFKGVESSFQTLLYVNDANGIVTSSETINQNRYGIWKVKANYAVYSPSGGRSGRFIYPVRVEGSYEEQNPSLECSISGDVLFENSSVYHFTPDTIPEDN